MMSEACFRMVQLPLTTHDVNAFRIYVMNTWVFVALFFPPVCVFKNSYKKLGKKKKKEIVFAKSKNKPGPTEIKAFTS